MQWSVDNTFESLRDIKHLFEEKVWFDLWPNVFEYRDVGEQSHQDTYTAFTGLTFT